MGQLVRRTVIDQIELRRDGATQIRFGLVIEEDRVEIDCKWHRTAVPPGGDLDAQIAAVDAHLALMGHPPVERDMIDDAKAIAALGAKKAPGRRD